MRTVRLRHIAQVNPPTAAFVHLPDDAPVTFLPMESVWPDDRLDLSAVRTKSDVVTGYTRFQDGDILVPKITPTFEASRSVLVSGLLNGVGAGTTELHVVRAGPEISARYLLYSMHTHPFLKLGEAEMYGVAGQKRVPDDFLRDLKVKLPSLEEQRRIADFLDSEAARIGLLSSLLQEVERSLLERKQSIRATELGRLVDKYGEIPFRRFISKIEQGDSPQCENSPPGEGEWGVLKLSSVKDGEFFADECKRLPEDELPRKAFEVTPGDLLVSRANTPELVGDAAVAAGDFHRLLLPDLIYRIGLTDRLLPEFAAITLRGPRVRGLIQSIARGSSQSMVKVRGEDIRTWPIPQAPLEDQKATVAFLEEKFAKLDQLRGRIQQQITLLAERRQAVITAAVTGQLDVTTAGRATSDLVSL